MSGSALGDFFKRRAHVQEPARAVKRFSDVDSDSDFEIEETRLSRPSQPSLSFKTEATEKVAVVGGRGKSMPSRRQESTSEGSIHFDSGSESEPSSGPAPAVEAPAANLTGAVPPACEPVPLTTAQPSQQSLAEKLFGDIGARRRAPPSPQGQQAIPQRPPTTAGETVAPLPKATPPASLTQPRQTTPPQRPKDSPPPAVLTEAHEGISAISGDRSRLREESVHDDGDVRSDGGFAESVLPVHPAATFPGPYLTVPPPQPPAYATPLSTRGDAEECRPVPVGASGPVGATAAAAGANSLPHDPSDELLVRARLRLEEKRRVESAAAVASRAATPRRHAPIGGASAGGDGGLLAGSTPASPREGAVPIYGYRDPTLAGRAACGLSPARLSGSAAPSVAPHMVEARLRRLTQENTRLQDEVSFLSREHQKMRAAAGSADSAESVKLQLTVDMLRKELQSKEVDHQRALREVEAERASLVNQVEELHNQKEGYIAAIAQYKGLYEKKVRELEQVKLQMQRAVQEVSSLEHRRQSHSQLREGELAAEREKVDKLMYLLEDVKMQRQHLHELNQQLQLEVAGLNEEKARLKAAAEAAEERVQQAKAAGEQVSQTVRQDVARLRDALAEKERVHAAQLREEQRIRAVLQQRLEEGVAEAQQEAARLGRAMSALREDHKRANTEERERRLAAEERLRQLEADSKASLAALKDTVTSDYERRVKKLREDLTMEQAAREAAQLEAGRRTEEADRLRDAVAYHAEQYQSLSADFAHSEQLRERAEHQCGELSATLQDLMHHDERQTRHMGHLEATVAELRHQLSADSLYSVGPHDGARPGASAGSPLAAQMQLLSAENERLTCECVRLAGERDTLIDENGKIAEELLKWKSEMRRFVSAQVKTHS